MAWGLVRREPVALRDRLGRLGGVQPRADPRRVAAEVRARSHQPRSSLAVSRFGSSSSCSARLEVGRWLELLFAAVQWHGCWVGWHTIPRLNLLRSLVGDPGPVAQRLPGSPGEAVSRFRDDTMDLAMVLDVWLDISGVAIASALAVGIMFRIDSRVTVVVVLPVLAALWLCHWFTPRLRAWRREAREATAAVTGFIGDRFGSIGAIKAAGAEPCVQERFDQLGATRAKAARRDEVGTQLIQSLSGATGNLGIGIALLLVAPAIRRGDFTVGDLGLFTDLHHRARRAPPLGRSGRRVPPPGGRLGANAWPSCCPRPSPRRIVAPVTTQLRSGPGTFVPTASSHARRPLDAVNGSNTSRFATSGCATPAASASTTSISTCHAARSRP